MTVLSMINKPGLPGFFLHAGRREQQLEDARVRLIAETADDGAEAGLEHSICMHRECCNQHHAEETHTPKRTPKTESTPPWQHAFTCIAGNCRDANFAEARKWLPPSFGRLMRLDF